MPGYVYVAGSDDTNLVKIGYTINPIRRLELMQTGSPVRLTMLATLPGTPGIEGALHRRLASHRQHGEWFDLGADAVVRVVATWLEIVQAEGGFAVESGNSFQAEPRELVLAVRGCFALGEDFIPTATLTDRLSETPGWWQRKWTGHRAISMGMARELHKFEVEHVRRMRGGKQSWGYDRADVFGSHVDARINVGSVGSDGKVGNS